MNFSIVANMSIYTYKCKAPISIFSVTSYSSSRFVTCWEKV